MKINANNMILYQIYPISFYDSNDDGIGDLRGIIQKMPYLKELGINTIWLSPCFASPLRDGGYDISDYYAINPKFGTMEDLVELFKIAEKSGIAVLLDLVVGHTSNKHKWFKKSSSGRKTKYDDYYVWTTNVWSMYDKTPIIIGERERDGNYLVNFYSTQPALNYGFGNTTEEWQIKFGDPRLASVKQEVKEIAKYYLKLGASGFRVDIPYTLVKQDDENNTCNCRLWNEIITDVKKEFPDAFFISEWSIPQQSVLKAGFDCDFILHIAEEYTSLLRNEKDCNVIQFSIKPSYFRNEGSGDVNIFIDYYLKNLVKISGKGFISIPSGNHDLPRISKGRTQDELKVFFAFLLTFKTVPTIYYGDEIGIEYYENINKFGGFNRTGSRTPMQWDQSKNNGFSENKRICLPIKNHDNSVSLQAGDPNSLLNVVKYFIELRKTYQCFDADADIKIIYSENRGYPFVYERRKGKDAFAIAINPSKNSYAIRQYGKIVCSNNIEADTNQIILKANSYAVFDLSEKN